jgi:disulfide bond formation protein DsbB
MKLKNYTQYLPYFVFIIALISTITSLFFSEVLKFTPCVLCWYQRIFMYPLVFICAVNITRKHTELPYYVLPISIIGFFIALYQNLLVWHILPETVAPCTAGVSCIQQPLTLFGFVTIPLGSLFAFALISASMLLYAKSDIKDSNKANRKVEKK